MPTAIELKKTGGAWLGAVRNWMQWNCRNGSNVTWGSQDRLQRDFTVSDVEEIAATAVAAYITEDKPAEVLRKQQEAAFKLVCELGWKEPQKTAIELMPLAVVEIQTLREQNEALVKELEKLRDEALHNGLEKNLL